MFAEPLLTILREREFCWRPSNPLPFTEYSRVYQLVWQEFARNRLDEFDFWLFDGSLLHHPLNDMLRNYQVSLDQATGQIRSLSAALSDWPAQVFYLATENVAEHLTQARKNRNQAALTLEQLRFWQNRKQMDLAVLPNLSLTYDLIDLTDHSYDLALDLMVQRSLESDQERQARLYPVVLSQYNPAWPDWYAEEKENLGKLLGWENIARISHIGSTAVPGLLAKPTIDILVEIKEKTPVNLVRTALAAPCYICLNPVDQNRPDLSLMFIKGYLATGFAPKVFHIQVRYPGEQAELYLRDYLRSHPETAAAYARLKSSLLQEFKHDRDGYTRMKGDFIHAVTQKAIKCRGATRSED